MTTHRFLGHEFRPMRTCTVMTYTDGTTSRYAVMRGRMRGRAFDAHTAETLAVYELVGEKPDYRAMTAQHGTEAAPAVYWQRRSSCGR